MEKNNIATNGNEEKNNGGIIETIQMQKKKKKNSWLPKKRIREELPLWRIYLNSYIENDKKLGHNDKLDKRESAVLHCLPDSKSSEEIYPPYHYLPFNTFNLSEKTQLPDRQNRKSKVRIWRNMRTDPEIDMSSHRREINQKFKQTDSVQWLGTCSKIKHDITDEKYQMDILKNEMEVQNESAYNSDTKVSYDDFVNHKELGHARVPKFSSSLKKLLVVDQCCGQHPNLVNGDYITFELVSKNNKEKHVYTEVCLRGTKGMHLIELNSLRARKKTWKFCFYQALVALLAKTQLRYKYASSDNIDYIYDHAWLLFIHMGSINIKEKHRFDDVVIYNYKYHVELEVVHELKDTPRITDVNWKYLEMECRMMKQLRRPELMKKSGEIDWEKIKQSDEIPVHEKTGEIEKWFDTLPDNYRNCIFRTSRFSIAFWNDGNFWYLYNPYRCDRYGFWDDQGYACIIKFCSRSTLRRHLIILLLRAYASEPYGPVEKEELIYGRCPYIVYPKDVITIQIFQMIYHCVKIHNMKFLQKEPPKRRLHKIWKEFNDYNYDPHTLRNKSMIECEETANVTSVEKSSWLRDFKITWTRSPISKKQNGKEGIHMMEKLRWHQYYIEEVGKLFSLWSEFHPTGEIFTTQNRGKQMHACYVVCAGMMRITAPEYWSAKTLDAIVMCGDRYYTLSRHQSETISSKNAIEHATTWNRHFHIGEILFEVNILAPIYGKLYTKDSLWLILEKMFLTNSFGILTCENACLGVFKFCGSYYMLDVKSIGPPIFNYGDGVAYLLRATSFHQFMVTLILTIGSIECSSFTLNPIEIIKIIDEGSSQDKLFEINQKQIDKTIDLHEKNTKKKSKKIKLRNKKTHQIAYKFSEINE